MAMLNDSAPAELDPERMGEQAGDAYVVEPSYDEGFDDAEEEGGGGRGHRSKRRTGAKKFVDVSRAASLLHPCPVAASSPLTVIFTRRMADSSSNGLA